MMMTFDWYIGASSDVARDPAAAVRWGNHKGPELMHLPDRPHVGDTIQIRSRLYRVKFVVWHMTPRMTTVTNKTAAGEEQKLVQIHGSVVVLAQD